MRRGLIVPLVILVAALPLGALLIARAAVGLLPDAPTSHWKWKRGHDSTVARTEVAAARTGDAIFVLGGFVPSHRTTRIVERYDIAKKRWSRVRPLPVALNHAAATGYGGYVYVLGGYSGATGLTRPVRTLYRYDPRADRWARLPGAPTARAALALGAVKGKLYAAGGSDGRRALATVEIYDIAKRRWSRGPALSVPREHLAGAVVEGTFYAIGGRSAATGNLAIAEAFRPGYRAWKRIADLDHPRGGNGAAGWNFGSVAVTVGGEEAGGTIGEVEALGGRADKKGWYRLPDMPTPRHGLGVVFDENGESLYALEGGTAPGFSFSRRLEILQSVSPPD